ncbi:hypothetical protein NG697_00765 [Pseudarthrobacter sp. MDT3-26]|uniref:hypothetical protein n=1 Tax=Pseudarthrobacter raffinosi TaxID=2953651 RepID=UPI00208F9F6C|nr:hypothetical protein [Pseudarthrobacter sp. MDT3-26]MCO4261484.1 hypothetical protein [Pseudarthrobacter sp. MDT3-26]
MTISVGELFEKSELHPAGVVIWGDQVPLDRPGVYVVASTPDVSDAVGRSGIYQPDFEALASLRTNCPSVTVDGAPATSEQLADRIGAFWIPESAVLYVGLAGTSVRNRLNQYYRTQIGQRAPHAGGWWLKTLDNLGELFVHYAATEAPKSAEARLLETFAAAVHPSLRRALHDSERIAPFANVQVQDGTLKRHGMAGYKLERVNSSTMLTPAVHAEVPSTPAAVPRPENLTDAVKVGAAQETRIESQVITDKDRAGSNLRIPARSKFALPAVDGHLDVHYQGQRVEARWRVNGSRSGTLGLGKTIMKSIGSPKDSIWLRVNGASIIIEE